MICQSCKSAADIPNPELHELCENNRTDGVDESWCDCHHRIGTERFIQGGVVKQMVERGQPVIPTQEPHREL